MDFPADRGQVSTCRCIACGREESESYRWTHLGIEDVQRNGRQGVLGGALVCSSVCALEFILVFTPDSDGAKAISLS